MTYFNYKGFWTREHVRSLVNGLILLALAVIFQYYASAYVNRVPSNSVSDLFLSILPVVNLNLIIVEGALIAIAVSILLILAKPQYSLFTLKTAAIFIATRAVFIPGYAHRHLSRPDRPRSHRHLRPDLHRPRA